VPPEWNIKCVIDYLTAGSATSAGMAFILEACRWVWYKLSRENLTHWTEVNVEWVLLSIHWLPYGTSVTLLRKQTLWVCNFIMIVLRNLFQQVTVNTEVHN